MPTSTRREKIHTLNMALEACRKHDLTIRTPAIADKIAGEILRMFGFSKATEKEYVRLLVSALAWENKNHKEFRFAD